MKTLTYYFHMKTKILADFQICISVPLNAKHLKLYHSNICFSGSCHLYTKRCLVLLLLICAGDNELNPDPKKRDSCYNLSLCYWNLNSIAAHNFSKLTQEAYNMERNFDLICLSETYFFI